MAQVEWLNDKENSKQAKISSKFKTETIQGPSGNEISFSIERGGIVKTMKLKGMEVLYLDEETFEAEDQNVRGGIPILFPNAGPLRGEHNPYPELKQHGFARTASDWQTEQMPVNQFSEKLISDEETRKMFPYDFELRMKGGLNEDGSITLAQEVTNLEKEKVLPIAMGLHPYFKVPNAEKQNLKFDFPGGEIVEKDFENWGSGGTTVIDNPKIKNPEAVLKIKLPGLGVLVMDVSIEYKKIWIWSLPGQDFVCIEPMMRIEGGLIDNPQMVDPGKTFSAKVDFWLE